MTAAEEEEFNKLVEKYESKIKVTANKYHHISRSMRTLDYAMNEQDLFQEGELILFNCWKMYRCLPSHEFQIIFYKSLEVGLYKKAKSRLNDDYHIELTTNYYNSKDKIQSNDHPLSYRKLSKALSVSLYDQYKDEYELINLTKQIEKKIKSKIGKAILYEFVNPSPRTVRNAIFDEKRKRMVKSQNKGNYVPKDITIQYQYIYQSLNITKTQFDYALREIKKVAREVLSSRKEGALSYELD